MHNAEYGEEGMCRVLYLGYRTFPTRHSDLPHAASNVYDQVLEVGCRV